MLELTLEQAYNRAGVYKSDSEFERDLKMSAWLQGQDWRCVQGPEELEQARRDAVDIIILKENTNVNES